jgi:hypothetical protein
MSCGVTNSRILVGRDERARAERRGQLQYYIPESSVLYDLNCISNAEFSHDTIRFERFEVGASQTTNFNLPNLASSSVIITYYNYILQDSLHF